MNEWLDGTIDEGIDVWLDVRIGRWMDGYTGGLIDE